MTQVYPSDVSVTKLQKLRPVPSVPHLYDDDEEFREQERKRRDLAEQHLGRAGDDANPSPQRLFLSHCWRNKEMQSKKRTMISWLSSESNGGKPHMYWADFLDLQAQGPIPWRKEIEDAISSCSKFVALVDHAWLTSFNCLQELAYALVHDKPVVILVLDQQAWNMLCAPSHQQAWDDDTWGLPLSAYVGQQITSGQKFSLEYLQHLYTTVSAINLCPCRPVDQDTMGLSGMLHNMERFVSKDLTYYKAHAELKNLALKWCSESGKTSLLLNDEEARRWQFWLDASMSDGIHPPPSQIQVEYVKKSQGAAMRYKRRLQLLLLTVVVLISTAAIASIIMAILSVSSEKQAKQQAAIAKNQTAYAEQQAAIARNQSAIARAQTAYAEQQAAIAQNQTAYAKNQTLRAYQLSHEMAQYSLFSVVPSGNMSVQQIKALALGLKMLSSSQVSQQMRITSLSSLFRWIGNPWYVEIGRLLASRSIYQVDWSPTGGKLAYACSSIVGMWFENGTVMELTGHNGTVRSVAWSPDGIRLASGSEDATVRIWSNINASGAESIKLTGHTGTVLSVAWSPNGTRLASGSNDGTVRIWSKINASGAESMELMGHNGTVWSVAWSPNGIRLASGSNDSTVRIWSNINARGADSIKLTGHNHGVLSVAWSPDGTRLASGSNDYTVRIWSKINATGAESIKLTGHTNGLRSVAWSPDGTRLASGSSDSMVRIWSKINATGAEFMELTGHHHGVWTVAWSPDGTRLASGSNDYTVRIWSNINARGAESIKLTGHNRGVASVAWSPDGTRLASGSYDYTVRIWSKINASGTESIKLTGHTATLRSVAWSPDGTRLASGSGDATVRIWSKINASGAESIKLSGHNGEVRSVAWSPDGTRLASGSNDATVRIWSKINASGAESMELMGHTDTVSSVVWSPDGTRLASGSNDGTVRIWSKINASVSNASQVESIGLQLGNYVLCMAWSPDGTMLACGSTSLVCLLSTSNVLVDGPAPCSWLYAPSNVMSLSWSPQNSRLAASCTSGILVWELLNGIIGVWPQPIAFDTYCRYWFEYASEYWTKSVSWSPNGTSLAYNCGLDVTVSGYVRVLDQNYSSLPQYVSSHLWGNTKFTQSDAAVLSVFTPFELFSEFNT